MLTTTQLPAEGHAVPFDSSSETQAQLSSQPETASSNGNDPSHQEIAVLAYSYWLSRGDGEGSEVEDWLRAERELRTE